MLDPFSLVWRDLGFIHTIRKVKMTSATLTWKNGFCLPLGFSQILVQDLRHSLEMKTIWGGSITGVPWVLILGSSFQSWLPCLWPLSSFLDSHLPLTSALGIFLSTLLPGLSLSRHGKCWESNVLAWCPCLALSRLSALFQRSVRAPLVLLWPDHYLVLLPLRLALSSFLGHQFRWSLSPLTTN